MIHVCLTAGRVCADHSLQPFLSHTLPHTVEGFNVSTALSHSHNPFSLFHSHSYILIPIHPFSLSIPTVTLTLISRCPVCRYTQTPEPSGDKKCFICKSPEVWHHYDTILYPTSQFIDLLDKPESLDLPDMWTHWVWQIRRRACQHVRLQISVCVHNWEDKFISQNWPHYHQYIFPAQGISEAHPIRTHLKGGYPL